MEKKINTIAQRVKQKVCGIGRDGLCCKLCLMGPCRLPKKNDLGVCGANQELIVARNILRFITGGASAHLGHAMHVAKYLNKEILNNYIKEKAPNYLYEMWNEFDLLPSQKKGIPFLEISEALHTTTMGVNADYQDVLKLAIKMAIIDGYYGLYLATELEQSKIGRPKIKESSINLDSLDIEKVNIAVHGHEPLLAMVLVEEAKKHSDINLVGVCCTGATVLAQAGIPLAAHFSLQEDLIISGLVDALVVDVHCIMPSISKLCDCYHTKLISTNNIARFPDADHLPISNEQDAKINAKKIIDLARANKKNRDKNQINKINSSFFEAQKVVVGFSEFNIDIDQIVLKLKNKSKKGIIAVVGCVNPRSSIDWISKYKELSKNYLILTTGCMAFEFGKAGVLDGQNFFHLGSCVNNASIAEIFKIISEKLDSKIHEQEFIVSAPMPITEKSIAIGVFFMALGCSLHVGESHFLGLETGVPAFLQNTMKDLFNKKIYLDTELMNIIL